MGLARLRRPEFLRRILQVEHIEVADLRPTHASNPQDLAKNRPRMRGRSFGDLQIAAQTARRLILRQAPAMGPEGSFQRPVILGGGRFRHLALPADRLMPEPRQARATAAAAPRRGALIGVTDAKDHQFIEGRADDLQGARQAILAEARRHRQGGMTAHIGHGRYDDSIRITAFAVG